MTTKREYLKAQGITVGVRGRFSGAAKVALQEAATKGIVFTAEPTNKAKQRPKCGAGDSGGIRGHCQPCLFLIQWRVKEGGK